MYEESILLRFEKSEANPRSSISWAQTVELIHPVQSPANELSAVNFSPTAAYTGKYCLTSNFANWLFVYNETVILQKGYLMQKFKRTLFEDFFSSILEHPTFSFSG